MQQNLMTTILKPHMERVLVDVPPRPPYVWTFLLLSKGLRELPEQRQIVGSQSGLVKSLCLWESSGAAGRHCCSYSISTILHAPSLILLFLSSFPLISLSSRRLFSLRLTPSLHFFAFFMRRSFSRVFD